MDKNEQIEHVLEILCKIGFHSIYSLITTLPRFNSLHSKESCQITLAFLGNKKKQSHFLEDNYFCQVSCKYTSVIASQEMEALVANKALWLLISKINIKTLRNFYRLTITQC